jgi:hypothetical protein
MKTGSIHTGSYTALALLGLLVNLGCGTAPPPRVDSPKSLPWQPLTLPRSEMTLPALLVGADARPSSGCFEGMQATSGTSVDSGSWTAERSSQLDASVKATFSKYLVDANLEAEVAKAMTQKWSTQVSGLTYISVDPANIQANFDNQTCTDADLGWFKDKRFVATEALKAATVTVKSGSALSASEKAKLDVAIDKVNAELKTAFSHATSSVDSSEFSASNAFIGVAGTTLGAVACHLDKPLEVEPGAQTPICGGKYLVALSKSAMDGRYSLQVTTQNAPSSPLDAPLNSQAMFKLGKLQVVFIMAVKSGEKFTIQTLDVLKVGAHG